MQSSLSRSGDDREGVQAVAGGRIFPRSDKPATAIGVPVTGRRLLSRRGAETGCVTSTCLLPARRGMSCRVVACWFFTPIVGPRSFTRAGALTDREPGVAEGKTAAARTNEA